MKLFISPDGNTVEGVATPGVDYSKMGSFSIKRASLVLFDNVRRLWYSFAFPEEFDKVPNRFRGTVFSYGDTEAECVKGEIAFLEKDFKRVYGKKRPVHS